MKQAGAKIAKPPIISSKWHTCQDLAKRPYKKYVLHAWLKTGIIDSSDQERHQMRTKIIAAAVLGITLVALVGTYVMMHTLANVRI